MPTVRRASTRRSSSATSCSTAAITAGTATKYKPSPICGEPTHQHLAKGFVVGMRFHSAPVIRLADAKPMRLETPSRPTAAGACSLLPMRGDPAAPARACARCARFWRSRPSPRCAGTRRPAQDIDGVFDVRAIFQQEHRELDLEAMPALLLPRKGRYGLRDYEKMFCPDLKSGNDIFDMRGIDRERGCMVVVRPDQYVAHVLPLEAHARTHGILRGLHGGGDVGGSQATFYGKSSGPGLTSNVLIGPFALCVNGLTVHVQRSDDACLCANAANGRRHS